MRILIASSEAVPYVKTGGLADVAGALLQEFRRQKLKASLILPLYESIRTGHKLFRTGRSFSIRLGSTSLEGNILSSDRTASPAAFFIECDSLFGRKELYGTSAGDYHDNALRFAFYSRSVLETCLAMNIRPDIIHCNDWQTGLVPLYLNDFYRYNELLKKTATILTIHNLGYQGLFSPAELAATGLGPDYFTPARIEFFGMVNYLKAGLVYSDILSTVSKTYASEILEKENGFGLDGVLRERKEDLYGIPNGLDYREWDPRIDPLIPASYEMDNFKAGKSKCKKALSSMAGFEDPQAPFFGIVSRLSSQKGMDLVVRSIEELVSLGLNIVILGRGEDYYHGILKEASAKYPGKIYVKIGFEEPLAHLIYAGSDFFLMPSQYEPCGLGQLIALKYGSIPIVRKTGGLADTVEDYDHLEATGTGFLFTEYNPASLVAAVKRALCVFSDRRKTEGLRQNAMKADFSWRKSADEYLELYKLALRRVSG